MQTKVCMNTPLDDIVWIEVWTNPISTALNNYCRATPPVIIQIHFISLPSDSFVQDHQRIQVLNFFDLPQWNFLRNLFGELENVGNENNNTKARKPANTLVEIDLWNCEFALMHAVGAVCCFQEKGAARLGILRCKNKILWNASSARGLEKRVCSSKAIWELIFQYCTRLEHHHNDRLGYALSVSHSSKHLNTLTFMCSECLNFVSEAHKLCVCTQLHQVASAVFHISYRAQPHFKTYESVSTFPKCFTTRDVFQLEDLWILNIFIQTIHLLQPDDLPTRNAT